MAPHEMPVLIVAMFLSSSAVAAIFSASSTRSSFSAQHRDVKKENFNLDECSELRNIMFLPGSTD
jgi:hypothetical protein